MIADRQTTDYGDVVDFTAEERARANKGRLRTLRAELTRNEDNESHFIQFEARCVRKFGPAAGIYVRQLVFWSDKGADPDGWIYKSEDEMEAETGLGRRDQRKARKVLSACEVLEEKRKGLPRRLFYRVNLEALGRILEAPGSTLNQWKAGARKDPETGKFYRPEPETLNHDYRQDGITDPTSEDGITDRASKDDSTDLARADGITDPASEDGNRDLASEDGITDRAITESTPEENVSRERRGTSESSSEEFLFQRGANGFSSRPTPAPINKNLEPQEPKSVHGVTGSRQASFGEQPNLDAQLLSKVKAELTKSHNESAAAEAYSDYQVLGLDAVYVMEAVARELGYKYLSEDLRRHVSVAMRELRKNAH